MMLGAMTIAILLAFILFTSLFSDSLPRNVIRYLRKKGRKKVHLNSSSMQDVCHMSLV